MRKFLLQEQGAARGFRPGYQESYQQMSQQRHHGTTGTPPPLSAIAQWAQTEQADLTALGSALTSIIQGVAALNAQIAAFNNSPGTLSPADQATLDSIQTASANLVTQAQSVFAVQGVTPQAQAVHP